LPLQETDHELFLQKVDSAWQGHCDLFLTIRSIFLYLDRSYVMQTPSLLSIWELGLSQFRQHLQSHGSIQFKTVQGLLAMIMRERNGEAVRPFSPFHHLTTYLRKSTFFSYSCHISGSIFTTR
jgi:cullin-4